MSTPRTRPPTTTLAAAGGGALGTTYHVGVRCGVVFAALAHRGLLLDAPVGAAVRG